MPAWHCSRCWPWPAVHLKRSTSPIWARESMILSSPSVNRRSCSTVSRRRRLSAEESYGRQLVPRLRLCRTRGWRRESPKELRKSRQAPQSAVQTIHVIMRVTGPSVGVAGVALATHTVQVRIEETYLFVAIVYPTNATDPSLRWESEDQSAATVVQPAWLAASPKAPPP